MQKLETLRQKVEESYAANNPKADSWIDWGYPNHVLFVANLTEKLAKKHGASVDLAVAGALLHDIADVQMPRRTPGHEARSLQIGKRLLQASGFGATDTAFVMDEIIKPHSCSDVMPTTIEGKVMATADAAAHFLTDFYPLFCWRNYGHTRDLQGFKDWMRAKLQKGFNKKIFFDDVRQEVQPHYKALKTIFLEQSK